MLIIGIDCATVDSKVGVARADYDGSRAVLREAQLCSRAQTVVETVAAWLSGGSNHALLAIDAPLGWPERLGPILSAHRAGEALDTGPNEMFRRATDRFIQSELAKTPLDVGADRIARTAHAALRLLANLRTRLSAEIPLAWNAAFSGVAAIEVYPAATLVAHRFRSGGYKARAQGAQRREVVAAIANVVDVGAHRALLEDHADVLDASVCILAAKDFLEGRAMPPTNLASAQREGWIWVARGPVASSCG